MCYLFNVFFIKALNFEILDKNLPVHNITNEEIEEFVSSDTTNSIKLLWIGHATSLINMENCIILIDPVFR